MPIDTQAPASPRVRFNEHVEERTYTPKHEEKSAEVIRNPQVPEPHVKKSRAKITNLYSEGVGLHRRTLTAKTKRALDKSVAILHKNTRFLEQVQKYRGFSAHTTKNNTDINRSSIGRRGMVLYAMKEMHRHFSINADEYANFRQNADLYGEMEAVLELEAEERSESPDTVQVDLQKVVSMKRVQSLRDLQSQLAGF